jgi:outer membrane protein TolC
MNYKGKQLITTEYTESISMKIKKLALFFSSIFLTVSVCLAQTAPAKSTLSWSDCVFLALDSNPAIASAQRALDVSKAVYAQSYNGIFPNLSLEHAYSSSENTTVSGGVTSTTGGSSSMWLTSGQLDLSIFNLSQIDNIKIAQSQKAQSEATLRQALTTVRYNLATAFFQLIYAQENVIVSQNIVSMRDTEAQLVTLRYDSGNDYKGDKLTANAELLQAQADVTQSLRDLHTAQRVLNQQLGLDEFVEIVATGTFAIQAPGDLPSDLDSLLENRPDVALQQAVLKTAEYNLAQAKSSLWPIISGNYTLSSSGVNEFSAPHSGWGIGLSYPIFGGGPTSTYYSIMAAKSAVEKAKQDLLTVREQALSDIESSWSTFMSAIDQIQVQGALLQAARTRNDEADIRYSSGLLTYDNWEIIASARISQEHSALLAQLTALDAEATWARSLGKQLEESSK